MYTDLHVMQYIYLVDTIYDTHKIKYSPYFETYINVIMGFSGR